MDDLSRNWNCKAVGGDDFPVVGVTKRIDDGVVEVGECLIDDPRLLFRLSGWVSARIKKATSIDSWNQRNTYEEIIFSQLKPDLPYWTLILSVEVVLDAK